MNWAKFVWDRRTQVVGHYFATTLLLVVVWLAFLRQEVWIGTENVLYVFALSTFALAAALGWEGVRQRAFLRSLRNAAKQGSPLNAFVTLAEPATNEQALFCDMAYRQFKSYSDELAELRHARDMQQMFADQWVHHMKTPVSVIGLIVQQAEHASGRDEAVDLLRSVGEENERIGYSLDMMLSTARLSKFEVDAHLRRTPLLSLVREAINAQKKACIERSIFPRIESQEEEIFVETDEKWLRIVLHQLISNAVKYSKAKAGSKTLLVTAKRVDGEVALSVRDEGIGIAKHDLPRVFDPFFTGENGRTRNESTGMGLYIAKQVCLKLGHTLRIDSEPGVGTTATIRFSGDALHKDLLS